MDISFCGLPWQASLTLAFEGHACLQTNLKKMEAGSTSYQVDAIIESQVRITNTTLWSSNSEGRILILCQHAICRIIKIRISLEKMRPLKEGL